MSAECACGCGAVPRLAEYNDAARGWVRGEPIRFIKGHNAKFWNTSPAELRFWSKVDKTETCWLWTASLTRQGYGRFSPTHSDGAAAHRYSYELRHGQIPDGLVIDHLCGVRACVNPEHLEAVTARENVRRAHRATRTNRCKRDHEFDEKNTRYRSDGTRQCRACARLRQEGYSHV